MLALIPATALTLLALLHVYWGLGGRLPARDDESLSALVVGTRGKMQGPVPCFVVAVLLLTAAALVMTAQSLPFARIGAWGVVAVLALRGIGGFFDARLRPQIVGLPYAKWNVILYSPLCVALAAITAATLV